MKKVLVLFLLLIVLAILGSCKQDQISDNCTKTAVVNYSNTAAKSNGLVVVFYDDHTLTSNVYWNIRTIICYGDLDLNGYIIDLDESKLIVKGALYISGEGTILDSGDTPSTLKYCESYIDHEESISEDIIIESNCEVLSTNNDLSEAIEVPCNSSLEIGSKYKSGIVTSIE